MAENGGDWRNFERVKNEEVRKHIEGRSILL
jgi:hypothetical protein